MSKPVIVGWIVSLAGTAIWLYGYFAGGNPSLINWQAHTARWIADFLPNVEAEIGMALIIAGTVLTSWLPKK